MSVNGLRYRTMINEFLWPELEDMDVDDIYLQHGGARIKPAVFCVKSFQGE